MLTAVAPNAVSPSINPCMLACQPVRDFGQHAQCHQCAEDSRQHSLSCWSTVNACTTPIVEDWLRRTSPCDWRATSNVHVVARRDQGEH
jgi:hypothetical protein